MVFTSTTLISLPARAQNSAAAAESLYQEGQRLMAAGNVHEACSKFAQSQKLEAATGTLLNLANCHEKEGKTASAWAEFNEAVAGAARSGLKDREAYARAHAEALQPRLRMLIIELPQAPSGTEMKLDGESFGVVTLGTPLPIDPGEHELYVSAPQKKPYTQKIKLDPGPGSTRIQVPPLQDEGSASLVASPPNENPPHADAPRSNTRRNVGYIVGGAGVLALGAGIVLGVRAKLYSDQADREQNRALDYVANRDRPNAEVQHSAAQDDHNAAKTNQTIGLVAGAAGLVAVGVGVYLIISGKEHPESSAKVTPLLSPNTAGAAASFSF